MKYVVAFGKFWWNFIVGDDWVAAVMIIAAIGITALVAAGGIASWWVMPLAVLLVLVVSLRRATASG
ncbi:MAG: hypothetical protein JOY72_05280 [Actinobacteria bacterium]|nr:hypothetical protein [Actinomycetota bacterium]